jgi:hypothetical protein
MRCLRAFGERNAARHPDSQTAKIQIRITLMNRFSALGTTEMVRVAFTKWGKEAPRLKQTFCNNACQHSYLHK